MKKIVLLVSFGFLFACAPAKKEAVAPAATGSAPATEAVSTGTPIATLNGQPITDEDVRKTVGAKLAQAEMDLYDVREQGVKQIVENKLLEQEAQRQAISRDDLVKKEITDKVVVSDKEIGKFFNENKDNMQGKKLDEVKENIRSYLFRQEHQKYYGKLVDGLKKKSDFAMLIKAPKLEIDEGENAAALGPKDAPVKVVEFTDYQCPFCSRSRPTVNQILDTYKGKVRYVLKDFPLSFHKDSLKAHESAYCAGDQGKYWEMNKKIWANQKAIGADDLKKYAQELKLDKKKFDDCLDSDKYGDKVRKNQQQGESVGVNGTPAFFINGRLLSGARPFDNFKEIIDAELSRK